MINYIDAVKKIESLSNENLILIDGDEPYLINDIKNRIIDILIDPSLMDFNLDIIDGKNLNFDKFFLACETIGFGSNNKVVIIDNINLTKSGISSNKDEIDKMIPYLKNLPSSTLLIIVNQFGISFNGKLLKQISKCGKIITCNKLNSIQLNNFINKYFLKNNKTVSKRITEYITDRIHYLEKALNKTLYDVENELVKILESSILDEITIKNVDDTLSDNFESNIFKLMDSINTKDLNKSIDLYRSIQHGSTDEFMIFHMILRNIRNMMFVKFYSHKKCSITSMTKDFGISKFEVSKYINNIEKWTLHELILAMHDAYNVERYIKTGLTSSNTIIENFLIGLLKKNRTPI